jgi:peptidoglycan/xylan/chitin deacetylase (PgdA/CDA1 family)
MMCGRCEAHGVSRRGFCRALMGATASLPIVASGHAAEHEVPVEPLIRLADVQPGKRVVALTFDCCPGGFDTRIANVLVTERIPATIFITWLWMRRNPEGLALLRAHPELFTIENHGERHIPPVLGGGTIFGIRVAGDLPTIRYEIEAGGRAIGMATGTTPRWYRAATGFYSLSVIPEIEAMGFAIGGYSFSADQGASLPAAQVAVRMANAKSGDVIVAHINQPLRPSGLGVVEGLRALQRQGTVFARLDQVVTTRPAYG